MNARFDSSPGSSSTGDSIVNRDQTPLTEDAKQVVRAAVCKTLREAITLLV